MDGVELMDLVQVLLPRTEREFVRFAALGSMVSIAIQAAVLVLLLWKECS